MSLDQSAMSFSWKTYGANEATGSRGQAIELCGRKGGGCGDCKDWWETHYGWEFFVKWDLGWLSWKSASLVKRISLLSLCAKIEWERPKAIKWTSQKEQIYGKPIQEKVRPDAYVPYNKHKWSNTRSSLHLERLHLPRPTSWFYSSDHYFFCESNEAFLVKPWPIAGRQIVNPSLNTSSSRFCCPETVVDCQVCVSCDVNWRLGQHKVASRFPEFLDLRGEMWVGFGGGKV